VALAGRLDTAVFASLRQEVLAMGLTWRDLVSSAAVVVMVWSFVVFQEGTHLLLLSSAWAASATGLVLGSVCAVSAAGDLHTRPQPPQGVIFRKITTVLGAIGLLAGLAGLIGNSGRALEFLVVATGFLWLTGTIWHVLTIGSQP
jgi:hypothetical protein